MENIRKVYYSEEYQEFYNTLSQKIRDKYDYVTEIIRTQYIINTKFVKKIEDTEFYEARISVGTNEYRTIIFAIDKDSFIESTRVIFLNSFLKKSTKQYKGEIAKAQTILNKYTKEEDQ